MDLRQVEPGHVVHAIARVLERAAQMSGRAMPISSIGPIEQASAGTASERGRAEARRSRGGRSERDG